MQKRYLRVCCALRNKLSTGGYWVGTLAIWNNLGSAWGGLLLGSEAAICRCYWAGDAYREFSGNRAPLSAVNVECRCFA